MNVKETDVISLKNDLIQGAVLMTPIRKCISCILSLVLVYCAAAQANPISNDELFNVPLLSLDMRDPTASHAYQKYEASVSCFSGVGGLYINSAKKMMYIGYSFDSVGDTFAPMGDVFEVPTI